MKHFRQLVWILALTCGYHIANAQQNNTQLAQPSSIIGKDGAEMVWIEGGTFEMGSNNSRDDEKPVHTVTVNGFYMDAHEVTNAQYRKFIQATGHTEHAEPNNWNDSEFNQPTQPVVGVRWYDAMAYAQWAGKRLPTEAEWEYAARGGLKRKTYPWGDDAPDAGETYRANYSNKADGYQYTAPVKSFAKNGYGLYDMAGNVYEWCLDEYKADFYGKSPRANPIAGESISDVINNSTSVKSRRVLRGGSWSINDVDLRAASRFRVYPGYSNYIFFGFRCVSARSMN